MKFMLKGNYLPEPDCDEVAGVEAPITIVEYVGNLGECKCRVIPETSLSFRPEWKPFTLRGYGKSAVFPRMVSVDMSNAKHYWNFRIPENNAFILYGSRAERDAQMDEEGLASLRAAEAAGGSSED